MISLCYILYMFWLFCDLQISWVSDTFQWVHTELFFQLPRVFSSSSNGRQVLETALAQTEASLSEAAGLCAMAMKVQQVLWFVPGYCEPIKYGQIYTACDMI